MFITRFTEGHGFDVLGYNGIGTPHAGFTRLQKRAYDVVNLHKDLYNMVTKLNKFKHASHHELKLRSMESRSPYLEFHKAETASSRTGVPKFTGCRTPK
jgi:hypothetical protein